MTVTSSNFSEKSGAEANTCVKWVPLSHWLAGVYPSEEWECLEYDFSGAHSGASTAKICQRTTY